MFPADFKGTCVEVGSYGPLALSNSRLFIEAGWQAHLIEPSPSPLRHLLEEYGANLNVKIYAGAMGEDLQFKTSEFTISDGPLSTDQESARAFWENEANFIGRMIVPVFPCFTFSGIKVDFLSVDTEGNSTRVLAAMLRHWPSDRAPKVICVERDDHEAELFGGILDMFGYRVVPHEPSAGVNRILRSVDF